MSDALRRHADAFEARHGVDPYRARVLKRLLACRTGALGGHVLVCDGCGHRQPVYKSCDDRHCPQCGGAKAARWLEERAGRMLDVPHFQVVFTLPSELRGVAHRNPRVVYPLMARVGASVLADLAAQRLDARLGITAVLHTWTSHLTLHPHWHLLVTAGGLSLDGQRWVGTRTDFLFPTKVIARMYRGRLLQGLIDAMQAGDLDVGEGVDLDRTLRLVSDHQVAFRTKTGTYRLEGAEFVRRFLLHVLPKGLRKVRHYGLYAPGTVHRDLEEARAQLPDRPAAGMPTELEAEAILAACERTVATRDRAKDRLVCPHCEGHLRTEPLARGPP